MSEAPIADWDMIHRWEWFRRPQWQADFRSPLAGKHTYLARIFAELAREIQAEVALNSACGLGRRTVCLAETGLNMVGSDPSEMAIEHARELARQENCSVSFFASRWSDLPHRAPHHFDCILNQSLWLIPTWDELGAALVGHFHALKPGGFLMFTGVSEGGNNEAALRRMLEEWRSEPSERALWIHRDGGTTCAAMVQKTLQADFIDHRLIYLIDEAGHNRLESTTVRRPGYWTWYHWSELAATAGFRHLETRVYKGYGPDGADVSVNVAWKAKDGQVRVDQAGRDLPYLD